MIFEYKLLFIGLGIFCAWLLITIGKIMISYKKEHSKKIRKEYKESSRFSGVIAFFL